MTRVVLRAVAVIVLVAGLSATLAPAAEAGRCKDISVFGSQGQPIGGTKRLTAIRTSCSTARRVARSWIETAGQVGMPRGFGCVALQDGAFVRCRNGRKLVKFSRTG